MFKKFKTSNFTGRINAFRVIERFQRMSILSGQNIENVKTKLFQLKMCKTGFKNIYKTIYRW